MHCGQGLAEGIQESFEYQRELDIALDLPVRHQASLHQFQQTFGLYSLAKCAQGTQVVRFCELRHCAGAERKRVVQEIDE